jgi:hypothetical protein
MKIAAPTPLQYDHFFPDALESAGILFFIFLASALTMFTHKKVLQAGLLKDHAVNSVLCTQCTAGEIRENIHI